ncbi:ABC transporter [Phytophthora megakarya]|uniref:ABC transporter n=1 Tax=Phytophthora megakarya TaxID=4795 RepID=A0A225WX75_9STRA|nr:ABC transporter [Phytophthora megakarya]
MEAALGKSLPQVEVRFEDLSITADIAVKNETDTKTELPTLPNEFTKSLRSLGTKKHAVKKHILKNVSGVLKPGTITLVLGQPGSGKSSLLQVLSGCFPKTKTTTVEGVVAYNGYPASELRKNLPQFTSYVSQRDKHYPALSVKETLEFAHACSGGGLSKNDEKHFVNGSDQENEAAINAARAMYQHYPEIVIHQLGLDNCQNTVVGDAMIRGVSGGERKRVTTGEMEFGNKYVIAMDEISTGLDSAATFDIIATQRTVCPNLNVANPVSLVSVLFFLMFGGFVITKDQIPDFLIWIYWINPMAWGVRALAVNQYMDPTFDTCIHDGTDYCTNFGLTMGEYLLQTFEVQTEKRGGETVFFGELGNNSSEMIRYFESIDGVAKLEKNNNPATWMLEVIGAGVGNDNGEMNDFVTVFKENPYVFISTLLFVGIFFPMVGFTGFGTFLTYWLYLSLHSLWHAYFGYFMAYVMPTVDVATIFGVLIISIFLLFSGFNPPGDSIPRLQMDLRH